MSHSLPAVVLLLALTACSPVDLPDDPLAHHRQPIRGGTETPVGTFDAVGFIPALGCTATLISKTAVLTAAHCACPGISCTPGTTTVRFDDVVQNGTGLRVDATFSGTVFVHPDFEVGGTPDTNDYAVIRLSEEVNDSFQISPIPVDPNPIALGTPATIVGYGRIGDTCDTNTELKHHGATWLDHILVAPNPIEGKTLDFSTPAVGSCIGDSGGPAIKSQGGIVGVCSTAPGLYDATDIAYGWIAGLACQWPDPTDPDPGYCDESICPCSSGEGDCDSSSQCRPGSSCVSGIGTASGLPSSYDLCWDNEQLGTFYTEMLYAGTAQSLPTGTWQAATLALGVGNDTISSLKLKPGLTARLWAENGCWGDHFDYAGDVPLLGGLLNDRTSCIVIQQGVTVYDSTSFSGLNQTYTLGNYNHLAMNVLPEDRISSLIASPGITVRLCSETGGTGTCPTFSGAVANVGKAINNRASNIEVMPGAVLYRDVRYAGQSQTLTAGTWQLGELSIGADTVDSMIVADGMKVTACHVQVNFPFPDEVLCRDFTGSVAGVGDALHDKIDQVTISPL